MAYVFQDPILGMPSVTSINVATGSLTQGATTVYPASAAGRMPGPHLGMEAQAYDPVYGNGRFIFLLGVASTALGSWVTYNRDDGTTALLAANAIGPVAVAMSANTSSSAGGWYQIIGKAIGLTLAGFVDNANVYATATAGSVDDAVVAGDLVKNAKGASAIGVPSGSFAEFEIDRPFMDDGLAA
jgi:hypothetical protein